MIIQMSSFEKQELACTINNPSLPALDIDLDEDGMGDTWVSCHQRVEARRSDRLQLESTSYLRRSERVPSIVSVDKGKKTCIPVEI